MKLSLLSQAALALGAVIGLAAVSSPVAQARPGCVKGAIVGGIAGHLAGHGVIGAAAGCAYGAHERRKYDREDDREGRSAASPPPQHY